MSDERREPERSQVPPRRGSDPLDPILPGTPPSSDHSPRHPSDWHADCAVGALIQAQEIDSGGKGDPVRAANALKVAETYATLSLRDAVLEAVATFKETTTTAIETNAELSETVKKATRHVVTELRKATVKAA